MLTRREFFSKSIGATSGGVLAATLGKDLFAAQKSNPASVPKKGEGTVLTLLGTHGGSRMVKMRAAPSQVIVINKQLYVVDCGSGVGRQLAFAGYNLKDLKSVFITHHHNDHNLDYGTILNLSISAGLKTKVNTYGPVPLQKMTEQFLEMYEYTDKQSPFPMPSLKDLVVPHEVAPGFVMEDENVKVSCARVVHPPCKNPYAFRFDTKDRSITISGDTAPSSDLIKLAKGSDVLVHEVYYKPFIEMLSARLPQYKGLIKWFPTSHTDVEQTGKIAHEAEVKTLVLSHIVPGDNPKVTDEMWLEGASKHFKGTIIMGRDLLSI